MIAAGRWGDLLLVVIGVPFIIIVMIVLYVATEKLQNAWRVRRTCKYAWDADELHWVNINRAQEYDVEHFMDTGRMRPRR